MEVSNIYTIVDGSDPRAVGAGSTTEVSYPIALLLLPRDFDESE